MDEIQLEMKWGAVRSFSPTCVDRRKVLRGRISQNSPQFLNPSPLNPFISHRVFRDLDNPNLWPSPFLPRDMHEAGIKVSETVVLPAFGRLALSQYLGGATL